VKIIIHGRKLTYYKQRAKISITLPKFVALTSVKIPATMEESRFVRELRLRRDKFQPGIENTLAGSRQAAEIYNAQASCPQTAIDLRDVEDTYADDAFMMRDIGRLALATRKSENSEHREAVQSNDVENYMENSVPEKPKNDSWSYQHDQIIKVGSQNKEKSTLRVQESRDIEDDDSRILGVDARVAIERLVREDMDDQLSEQDDETRVSVDDDSLGSSVMSDGLRDILSDSTRTNATTPNQRVSYFYNFDGKSILSGYDSSVPSGFPMKNKSRKNCKKKCIKPTEMLLTPRKAPPTATAKADPATPSYDEWSEPSYHEEEWDEDDIDDEGLLGPNLIDMIFAQTLDRILFSPAFGACFEKTSIKASLPPVE
jgi:hypothetical protein